MINSPTASSEWSIRSRRLIDLSGLVHNLNVVTVGGEYPGCVIVRMILELGRRCSFLPSACCNCSYKEGIHLRMGFGDKTEVNGIRIGSPLFEPEEEASVISEAFKVWVTILAFIVEKIGDPERLESLRVKRDRTRKITHGHDDVVEHRIPPCSVGKGSCGLLRCELRNQRDTSNFMILAPLFEPEVRNEIALV